MEVSTVDIHNEVSDLTTVDSGLYQHLVRLLGLSSRDRDISILVGYRQKIATLAVRDAWSQDSFIEDYVRRTDLDLYVVFGKLLRENPSAPLNPTIFGVSPRATRMPPILFPLYPVSQRANEITIASEIPGLNRLLSRPDFRFLNEFWGVERLNAVWAEPAHLREVIRRADTHITFARNSAPPPRDASNGGVPWIALDGTSPSDKINQWFSPALQRKYSAVPVYAGKRILTLAVSKLLDPRLKAEIEGALRHRFAIQQVMADESALKRFITASESRAINTSGIVQAMLSVERSGRCSENLEVIQADKLHQSSGHSREDEHAVIKFVHSILYKAVDMSASDIMFQEYPHRLRVRYKLDGDWFDENGDFPGHISKQVISRIKVISGLEIQYVRVPQDGSFPIKIGDQRYDFRVNTSYHAQGEQAVLRLQRDHRSIYALDALGMPDRYVQAIEEMMNGDNGLLILCGPTGSGKTTTIYSILKSLDAVKNNILTAESPIEIFIENISQTQIDEHGPYDYATWARGILRQAPDIVMMGEIRDEESVDALMRLSSSGHRAISTLHTNSVCEVPNRFQMFKAQPFMVADALKMAISQRLVKKICPRCYVEEPVPARARLSALGIDPKWLEGVSTLRRRRRCEFCRNTGVSGRKPIFEMLVVDDEIKAAIQERTPAAHLKKLMSHKGESTIFEKAVREAGAGVISLDEACKFRDQIGQLIAHEIISSPDSLGFDD
jgi:type II secretory ATPase GspE/PulE/Tfp pilus assembly ATPase PilB-like protein